MMSPIVIPEVEGMSVIKVIEVVSTSPISWQDAVEEGIKEASRTIHNIVVSTSCP
jgi:flavin-binding protein dodecin